MKNVVATTLTLFFMAAGSAFGEDFEIRMLDVGEKGRMVFEPDFLRIHAGDVIKFVPTDKGHNAETIMGMIPSGATAFKSKVSQEFLVTLTEDGVYGIRCTPHFGLGMVALIVVGVPGNVEEAATIAMPPKAKKAFEDLFLQVETTPASTQDVPSN